MTVERTKRSGRVSDGASPDAGTPSRHNHATGSGDHWNRTLEAEGSIPFSSTDSGHLREAAEAPERFDDESFRGGRTIAALYVASGGVYYDVPGIEPWGLPDRDARLYAGPHPVIAHPPCARWGRYATGGPNPLAARRVVGDDDGCFAAAIKAVRQWGGVLEHPADSLAWAAHELIAPPREGGWVTAGDWLGWTCCVEQGHYGHAARKATWLYACCGAGRGARGWPTRSIVLPSLKWGPCAAAHPLARLDDGYHSSEERRRAQKRGTVTRLGRRARMATPIPFRDVLLAIVRGEARP